MSGLGTLVPEGPCCVFYTTKHQVYLGLTFVVFCCYSNLISHIHKHTHTNKHSTLWGQLNDTPTCIN